MARSTSSWILLTVCHITETYILYPEGDSFGYVIAPEENLKKGDTVYLWWNPGNCFYGWGTVAKTPRTFYEENAQQKRKRQSVLINRAREFNPRITVQMMLNDSRLKNMVPTGFDDLYAIPLRPGQAHYINDFIREHGLDVAPQGSATTNWLAEKNAPEITIQTILTFGDKTKEGQLVEGVRIAWDELIKHFARNPEEIYEVDPRKLEEIIAGAYSREGYKVELTPRSGDKGRDVVATKEGIGSIRIFDQVKRYKISRVVTLEEVASLLGTITAAGNVSKGVITTTSTFAPKIYEDDEIMRLVPHRLELKPRDILLPWLNGLRKF